MKKILVVEDDKDLRDSICDFLIKEGFTAIVAYNGEDGLEIARKNLPDLILSDIEMHTMDGFDFVRNIKKDTSIQSIPFIFLTVKHKEDDILQGLTLGAQDYVCKPFKYKILLSRIQIQLDLVSRKQLEERNKELSLTLEKISSLLEEKKEFINKMAHDIRNQLTPVIGYSDLLKVQVDCPEVTKATQIITNNSNLIKEMVAKIVENIKESFVTKVHEYFEEIHNEKRNPLDIGKLAKEVFDSHVLSAERKSQKLIFHCNEPVSIKGNRLELDRVMTNLVNNAIKYTYPNKTIEIFLEKDNDFGYFKVIDQGVGLSEEQINKLRTDPCKVGNIPTGSEESHGIGLKIVLVILKEHGGELDIKSEPEKGSTFTIKLPLFKEEKNVNS